ncbi:hypothetical protein Csa_006472 [Cucumis sativus]|uniref:Uncharacterized protein n=1 Tax=Cucumis sativus TaxID=3659 RepID=A0A0A0LLP3_CUCSA|nr:hypothetical protein Csa_006472 [Cucumis sativus]
MLIILTKIRKVPFALGLLSQSSCRQSLLATVRAAAVPSLTLNRRLPLTVVPGFLWISINPLVLVQLKVYARIELQHLFCFAGDLTNETLLE